MNYDCFQQTIYDDIAWRKKEITKLYFLAGDKKDEVLLKSLILILYAHWEGNIKNSSKLYIKFICEKRVNISELTNNFAAISLKTLISSTINAKNRLNLREELAFITKYSEFQNRKFAVSIDVDNEFDFAIIDTRSNLKPKVFKNIMEILGMKYGSALRTRENYIDNNLLKNRNAIGHGAKFDKSAQNDFDLCIEDIAQLKNFVIAVLDFYVEALLAYIENEFYLESNLDKKNEYDDVTNSEFEKVLSRVDL